MTRSRKSLGHIKYLLRSSCIVETLRSCSIIRSIFSAPLPLFCGSPPLLPPPLPGLLKCILAQDPCLWQPELYMCTEPRSA